MSGAAERTCVVVAAVAAVIKYTPPGGRIELVVNVPSNVDCIPRESPAVLGIILRDDGVGISPDVLPHMFELFAQAPQSIGRSEGGSGIGLAVAKRMVELHGGTISIDNRCAGRGTVVSLRLPILDANHGPRLNRERVTAHGVPSLRALLVDDNIDALGVLRVVLELEGHKVITASTGQDAIRIAGKFLPEVAIIDIGMPDMDGFELVNILRSHAEFKDAVLLALTGYSGESDRFRALSAGFDHYLVKPLSLDTLQDVLSGCSTHKNGPVPF